MIMEQNKITIVELFRKHGAQYIYGPLFAKHKRLVLVISTYGSFLPDNARFVEKLYVYFYDLTERPHCLHCGENVSRFYGFSKGYALFCSNKCVANSIDVKEHKKNMSLKRYGVENPSQAREVEEKRIKTLKEKYNVDSLVELRYWKDLHR